MLGWLLTLAVFTVLSYLLDIGVLPFLRELRVPVLNASILSILLLVCTIAMLGRVLGKVKTREKEELKTKISRLEKELEEIREKIK